LQAPEAKTREFSENSHGEFRLDCLFEGWNNVRVGSITEADKTLGATASSCDPRRVLLSRIAAGTSFAKAPRLRELLLYLGESALKAPQTPLTEQQVGIAVFNRSAGYDTSSDTIVRVQASEIRKRLKHYFDSEGRQEPIVMDLPRGSYVPVFYYRQEEAREGVRTEVAPLQSKETKTASLETAAPRELEPSPADEIRKPAVPTRSALVTWLASLLGIALLLCAWLAYQNARLRIQPATAVSQNHLLNVLPGECVATLAGKGWTQASFPVQTRIFTATFDAIPGAATARVNDVVAISDGAQNTISKFPVIVAFSETGYILARNGSNYTAVNTIRYTPDVMYHFRLVIDVPAHTYAVYVTPSGGAELTVGTNFAFRSEAGDVRSLNSIGSLVDTESGAITFCNFSLT
jgi:hypothetical protein